MSSLRVVLLGLAMLMVILCLVQAVPVAEEADQHEEPSLVRNKRYYPYGGYYGGYAGGYPGGYYDAPYTRQVVYRRTVYPNNYGYFW